jgi:hypothetical protein
MNKKFTMLNLDQAKNMVFSHVNLYIIPSFIDNINILRNIYS